MLMERAHALETALWFDTAKALAPNGPFEGVAAVAGGAPATHPLSMYGLIEMDSTPKSLYRPHRYALLAA